MNWETSQKCLVIAHRGDMKRGVENTLPAIESALKLGVDGIEVDLRMTHKEIVLHHDPIEKTTSGLTTLEELLDLVGDRVLLNLEIKEFSLFNGTLEKTVLETLKRFHLGDSILLSSFHPLVLARFRKMAPGLALGYLYQNAPYLHRPLIRFLNPFSVNLPYRYLSLSDSIRRRGRRCFVWTVNGKDDMKKCLAQGVDGIITDEPEKLISILS